MSEPKKEKVRYDQVLKKWPKKKYKRPRPPSQEELKKAYDAGDDMVGIDENGRYYLD
jgi:hypothetical protein